MDLVNVNLATPEQLSALLHLPSAAISRIVAARPFATPEAFSKSVPELAGKAGLDLNIPKLDINAQTADALVKTAGISPDIAQKIVAGRPYYVMHQLQLVAGADAYQKLQLFYGTPDFHFVDKLTGQQIQLTADPSQLLVSNSQVDTSKPEPTVTGAEQLFKDATDSRYHVYATPESESAVDIVAKLQDTYKKKVIPAFQDNQSSQRYFNPQYCVVQFKQTVPADLQTSIIAQVGATVEEQHRSNGLYTLKMPEAATNPGVLTATIAVLNAKPEVQFCEPNYFGFDDRDATAPKKPVPASAAATVSPTPWNLALVNIPKVWATGKGSPDIVIAIIDSGVDIQHPALKDAIMPRDDKESFNFAANDDPNPTDEEGHGTFIAGILAGNGQMDIHGICPGCRILPLKISLTGNVNSYARRRDAILFAVQRAAGKRLIINMSWKTAGDVGLIRDAVTNAAGQGAILIASAGNLPDFANEPHFPSDYPEVIAVAAVGPNRMRTDYSYFGDNVDVSAPGGIEGDPATMIRSAAPGAKTDTGCGTSFAAPHVVGIAALTASAHSALTADQIRFVLEMSAFGLTEPGMGRGLCDASAALALAGGNPMGQTGKPPVVPVAPKPPVPAAAMNLDGLTALNTLDAATLSARFGLATFTAKLLVAHRPFKSIDQAHGILGLTDQQFALFSKAPSTGPASNA